MTSYMPSADSCLCTDEWFSLLFGNSPTMVVIVDVELKIVAANPCCCDTLGYSCNELEGRRIETVFDASDRTAVFEACTMCLQTPGEVFRWNFQKVRKDGTTLWVEESLQSVQGQNGQPYLMIICQDLTERRRAEEEISRLNDELKIRADELEAMNRELSAFNHSAAHDLRQPLSILSSYCQLIQEMCGEGLSDDCQGMLSSSYNLVQRMDELIGALLKFSDMKTVESRREKVNLSMLAQEVSQTLTLLNPERLVEFRIADGMIACGDPNLLRMVLENLFGNAWKYTRTRERAVIEFGVKEIGGTATYFVRDNGQGFDTADAASLFTPFHRLASSEDSRGFGVGLATVQRIISRHGGIVYAEGEAGKYACFYFTLNGHGTCP